MLTPHTSTKQVTEWVLLKYKNTTIIKSDSIKVFTVQYVQQIIAPNLKCFKFCHERVTQWRNTVSSLSGFEMPVYKYNTKNWMFTGASFKGTVQSKMKIQLVGWIFIVDKTFLELHSKIQTEELMLRKALNKVV